MITKIFAFTAAILLSASVPTLAQTPAGGGTEGNMNNPGSVKSNTEKMNERTSGSPTTAGAVPGASGGPSTATTGAPAGSTGGNAATGSGAAPSGK